MVNCFIEFRKSELKAKLKEKGIRSKHHDAICDSLKLMLTTKMDAMLDFNIQEYQMKKNWQLQDFYEGTKR